MLSAMTVTQDDGRNELRMVLSDINERKLAEERLVLAESVFSHAREGIIVTDAQGSMIEVNEALLHGGRRS